MIEDKCEALPELSTLLFQLKCKIAAAISNGEIGDYFFDRHIIEKSNQFEVIVLDITARPAHRFNIDNPIKLNGLHKLNDWHIELIQGFIDLLIKKHEEK